MVNEFYGLTEFNHMVGCCKALYPVVPGSMGIRYPAAPAASLAAHPAQAHGEKLMYQHHFALTRLPFETQAHTDELFESNARREAQARLHHLIELKGIGLLTGEVGSGKSTVCRHVTATLHPGLYGHFGTGFYGKDRNL